jgi:hypothetical protein
MPGQYFEAGNNQLHFLSNSLFINHTNFLQQVSVSSNTTWIFERGSLTLGLAHDILTEDKGQEGHTTFSKILNLDTHLKVMTRQQDFRVIR